MKYPEFADIFKYEWNFTHSKVKDLIILKNIRFWAAENYIKDIKQELVYMVTKGMTESLCICAMLGSCLRDFVYA